MDFYTSESGPIQVLSAGGYITVAVMLWREAGWPFIKRHPYFLLVPIAMCLRELDFHAHFTTMTITKTLFFVSPEVPVGEKIAAVIVYAILIWMGGLMVARHTTGFLAALSRGAPYAISLALGAFMAVFSKAIDGKTAFIEGLGIPFLQGIGNTLVLLEEVLELGIPVFFLIAVLTYFPRDKRISAAG